MGTPLRGELTLAARAIPKAAAHAADMRDSLDNIQGVLAQVVRLSTPRPAPAIVVSPAATPTVPGAVPGAVPRGAAHGAGGADADADAESAAPWSWTAAEAVSTETALLPLLMHLAAAKDDVGGLAYCLSSGSAAAAGSPDLSTLTESQARRGGAIVGGVANCIDPASGHAPLHVAALNGSEKCVGALLEAGALVHLRDALGHTPLYYVRFPRYR